MTDPGVWLGVGTDGADVRVRPAHLALFGQTQKAGKTTSGREILYRAATEAGCQVLVFRSGRGDIAFDGAPSTPYFRERLDWHGVESMVWSFLQEKPKVYRPIIMRAVRGARTLEEFHHRITSERKTARQAWVVDRLYELDQYFQEILPWIREHRLASTVRLSPGVSIVDLEGWPLTVQQLVVAATLEALMEEGRRARPLLVFLPEARRFIPSDSVTPVTRAADHVTTQGAKLGLYLWIDSQALTGVNQQILRNFALVLQGVQTHDLEIRRVCKALDGVKPRMVRELQVGDFILHTDSGVRSIHVPLSRSAPAPSGPPAEQGSDQEAYVNADKEREYQERIGELERRIDGLSAERLRAAARISELELQLAESDAATPPAAPAVGDETDANGASTSGARSRADLRVFTEPPELTVHVKVVRLEAGERDLRGRLALLLADGVFDKWTKQVDVAKEIAQRGGPDYRSNGGQRKRLQLELTEFCEMGFLRRSGPTYQVLPEAKARIRRVEA